MLSRKVGIVDLKSDKVKLREIPKSLRRFYLGGRGINVYYLSKLLKRGVDPLSERNILIFGVGFLTGTSVPSSSRFNVTAKSPETGILGDSSCGAFFGAELRYAGFDHLIINGRSRKPVLLIVSDEKIEVQDAQNLWGRDTIETQKILKKEFGIEAQIACIGEAGENLCRFSCVRTGYKSSASRGGMGAVMGSKNLKALVVLGSKGLRIEHPEDFLKETLKLKNYILSSKITRILGTIGTPLLYEYSNVLGCIRCKNSQLNAFKESLNGEEIEKYIEKMTSCFACHTHCRHRNSLGGEGPEYSAVGLLGANLGISDPLEVIELNNLCNRLGLDISSVGSYLSWVLELFERGLISEELTEERLEWGNFKLFKNLILKISKREGFGNILAEGSHAVRFFGKRSKDYLIAVKNLPQSDPHDCRYIKAFALGIATASRGADHLRSRPTLEIFTKLPLEVKERIYGEGVNNDPTSYDGKELGVYFSENIFAVCDAVGICKFVCHGFNSPHFLTYSHFRKLIYLSTGMRFDEQEFVEIGKNIVDTERLFNLKEGIGRRDDTLPQRYFVEKMKLGIAKGHRIERKEFEKMLSRYYKLRGWLKDGTLKEERVKQLEKIKGV
ncbi:MAG: aldehyde ferredoxin oxidoreductase family protein [Candidatus Methanofastidiosia archaeon]